MGAFGYAARSESVELGPFSFERRQPRPDDVVLPILFCGIWYTDLHIARNHGGCRKRRHEAQTW
jgi:alcohol dehydrogenase (NADP+)